MTHFLRLWCLLFLPYQNLLFYRPYFGLFTDLIIYRNVRARQKVYLVCLLNGIYSFQMAYLWLTPSTPMVQLRQADLVFIVLQNESFHLAFCLLCPLAIYYLNSIFFTMKVPFLRLLGDIFIKDTRGTLTGIAYGPYTEQRTAQLIVLTMVNLLHIFILAAGLCDTILCHLAFVKVKYSRFYSLSLSLSHRCHVHYCSGDHFHSGKRESSQILWESPAGSIQLHWKRGLATCQSFHFFLCYHCLRQNAG